jgi:hypothetical protein
MTKRNFIKTTKTIQTLYIIPLLDDASNKNNNNVLIMKSITTKRNSIFWVSKKNYNHTYPTMATLIYESKKSLHSETFFNRLKFYITFVLVATRCNKVDYWFEKRRMKGPNFCLTYKHNYQKFTHLKTLMLEMNKNNKLLLMNTQKELWIIWFYN